MNVRELIEILSQYNPDDKVVVDGYESGFDDIGDIRQRKIVLYSNEWYEGSYRNSETKDDEVINVVSLARGKN